MRRLTHRHAGIAAVTGALVGVGALLAAVYGAEAIALMLASAGFIALTSAFVGAVVTSALEMRRSKRQPSYTGEIAWLREMLRQQSQPRPAPTRATPTTDAGRSMPVT